MYLPNATACLNPESKRRMATASKDKYCTLKKCRAQFLGSTLVSFPGFRVPTPLQSHPHRLLLLQTLLTIPFARAVISHCARHLVQLISLRPRQHHRRQHCSSRRQRSWSCHRARLAVRRGSCCCTLFAIIIHFLRFIIIQVSSRRSLLISLHGQGTRCPTRNEYTSFPSSYF